MVLEETLKSLLDCKEIQSVHPNGDQSWIFIGKTDAEAKLQYFGHLMRRIDTLGKTLMLGRIEGRRRRRWKRMRWLNGITDMSFSRPWELVMDRETWRAVVHRVAKSWTWLSDWNELNWIAKEREFLTTGNGLSMWTVNPMFNLGGKSPVLSY